MIEYRFHGYNEEWMEWPYYPEITETDLVSFDFKINGKVFNFDNRVGFMEEYHKVMMWKELQE